MTPPAGAEGSRRIFDRADPIIGVIHAPPLPGSPGSGGSFEEGRQRIRDDAGALARGGADGILLENFGDAPFYPTEVPPETVAHLTVLAGEVRSVAPGLPLGLNVLRNDGLAALAVAEATGGGFIRVNVLSGARLTDQGIVEGQAHRLLRRRRHLESGVMIFADVDVKHSAALARRPVEEEARELVERSGADALVVTGDATGEPVDREILERVVRAAGEAPVLAGSGVTPGNAAALLSRCGGIIVGSALRADGRPGGPVVEGRVRDLTEAARDPGPPPDPDPG